jgi:N-acetylglucosamine kinase-like BadF-type ATPase
MELFLGVDGGQSSTTALLADETGRVIGVGADGPCNHVASAAEGREKFIRVISGCVRSAAEQAGLGSELPHLEAACLGFSGGPADKEPILRDLLHTKHLSVRTDAEIALSGATGGGPGIITIAGTGNISFGRNAGNRAARAGGWGYYFGDEGGAFDIVRQAVRAILKQHEGWGPPTSLLPRFLEETGSKDANAMMHAFYTAEWPRKRLAGLARIVDQEAERADPEAIAILERAARDLLSISEAVQSMLFLPGEAVALHPVGSTWSSRTLRDEFILLWTSDPVRSFLPPLHGPAAGALLEAFRLAGCGVELSNVPETEK